MCAASLDSGGPDRAATRGGRSPLLSGEARLKSTFAAMVLLLALGSCGQGGSGLAIENAQFRPPLGASGIGVAYFTIRSDKGDRIVSVSSSAAESVEIHTSVSQGDNVSMRRVESVDLPA